MLVVISPAKRLDWNGPTAPMTVPQLQAEADALAAQMRTLSAADLKALMHLSDDLARLNRDRYAAMTDADGRNGEADLRPAALAFAGDTYRGLSAATLDRRALAYADDHLRILSGLYGVLRPRDGIAPHRLEMGTRLATDRGATLYDFWGGRIAAALNAQADATDSTVLLNCASKEYFAAIDSAVLRSRIVTPQFLEERNGARKVVSFHAKRARGAMARFVVETRARDERDLRDFAALGYRHDPAASRPGMPVFVRDAGPTA
ncbi:hypothetical protein OCGS_1022 [Oceaniovalibus guishaninsula JLT2003]|uniref:UPF0246 protein OCGS_1022 n=1 Tax=Oceaniovalibus guishaninsula JLT2003 TaxID=1231392 RepID=K2HEN1_9RHOB|nr:peroxide stress protein YaaA [Oceaniovalibus guishaninsula]EKE44987.1 hypothetical protein OCGS_1022 [Oceaniovalibus guishaninsula JLT2003]